MAQQRPSPPTSRTPRRRGAARHTYVVSHDTHKIPSVDIISRLVRGAVEQTNHAVAARPQLQLTSFMLIAPARARTECGQVALLDYDGIPLQRMDPFIFDACGSAPLCGVVDQVTPINNAIRSQYMNTGAMVIRHNSAMPHTQCTSLLPHCLSSLHSVHSPSPARADCECARMHARHVLGAPPQPHNPPPVATALCRGRRKATCTLLRGAGILP